MIKKPAIISYRTKIETLNDGQEYIVFKKTIGRGDCNLRPHDHAYYNADMFPRMLNIGYRDATGGLGWCLLSKLPDPVKVIKGKFLSEVQVAIEV